jgi:hypothetical protein
VKFLIVVCLCEQGLDLPSAMLESEKQGIPFDELLAIPERDDWEYGDGYSTCVAFILQMYKEAGLFGSLSTSIQVTEFGVCVSSKLIASNYPPGNWWN